MSADILLKIVVVVYVASTLAACSATMCFETPDCSGQLHTVKPSPKQCCVETDEAAFYMDTEGNCKRCIVHGFEKHMFMVEEGNRANTAFRRDVKGTSKFESLNLPMLGTITSEPVTASPCDFEDLGEVKIGSDNVDISLLTINDDITLESNDIVKLVFKPLYPQFFDDLEKEGEFVRETTFIHIVDNDVLEINFDESRFSLSEGGELTSNIRVQFRKTQEDFNLTLTSVTLRDAANMSDAVDAVEFLTRSDKYVAKEGTDFRTYSKTFTIPATENEPTKTSTYELRSTHELKDLIMIVDDDIHENDQSFALLGNVVANGSVCFQSPSKQDDDEPEPCKQMGVAEILIIDDDPMTIGFAKRTTVIQENDTTLNIRVNSTIKSEREHLIQFDLLETRSTATVEGTMDEIMEGSEQSDMVDARLPGIKINGSITFDDILLIGSTGFHFTTSIVADTRLEGLECYTLRLSAPDAEGERDVFSCNKDEDDASNYFCHHTICIEDTTDPPDPCVVGFDNTMYPVNESAGVVSVCVNLMCPESHTNMVRVEVSRDDNRTPHPLANGSFPTIPCGYNMKDTDDYEEQIIGCNGIRDMVITEGGRACYDQIINNDLSLERTEYAGLKLTVRDSTALTDISEDYGHATIKILDDEDVSVSLQQTYYMVLEDVGVVEVCAVVDRPVNVVCPVTSAFDVILNTVGGTADEYLDFMPVNHTMTFKPCERRNCVNITIREDDQVERNEIFHIFLKRTTGLDKMIKLKQIEGRIEIVEDDYGVVSLTQTVFNVGENKGTQMVCAMVVNVSNCPIDFEFSFVMSTRMRTAVLGRDYMHTDDIVTIAKCGRAACTRVAIIDDASLENVEEFVVTVEANSTLNPHVIFEDTQAVVTIADNDDALFGLESDYCRIVEDENEILVCVETKKPDNTDCPVAFEFSLHLSITSDTADFIGDHDGVSGDLVFPTCISESCTRIPITDDMMVEQRESFFVSLQRTEGLDTRIQIDSNFEEKEVTIVDDDRPHVTMELIMTVDENRGYVEVCVLVLSPNISCPIVFPFEFIVHTIDGTAKLNSDYSRPDENFRFSRCQKRDCLNITIINDCNLEDKEYFTVSLERGRGVNSKFELADLERNVSITDMDDALISFEHSYYQVTEDGGHVTVCAIVERPHCYINFAFNVSLFTQDRSAVSSNSLDYISVSTTLIFAPRQTRSCVNIEIIDDCIVEDEGEEFDVFLMRPDGLDNRIQIKTAHGVVNITDEDVLLVGLEHRSYTAVKTEESIRVCIVMANGCYATLPFNIRVRTLNNSADAIDDYTPMNEMHRFSANQKRLCVNISIVDDMIVEQRESFSITLERTPDLNSRITLFPDSAEVVIPNNDEAVVGFASPTVAVTEDQGMARVCVEIFAPDIDCPVVFPFDLIITASAGTAVSVADYSEPEDPVRFPGCEKEHCTDIKITDDNVLEPLETFTISLMRSSDIGNEIRLEPDTMEIVIIDEDEITLEFERSVYTTSETKSVLVCASVTVPSSGCASASPFTVNLLFSSGTADFSDYGSTSADSLEFSACSRQSCATIRMENDLQLEEDESFSLVLQSPNPRHILDPSGVTIEINNDTDAATVAMEQATVTVMEGDIRPVFVCANVTTPDISCPVDFDFDITFSVSAESTDYDGLPATVKFPACALGTCVNVTIVDDAVVKNTESFRISLTRTTGLDSRITLTGTTELQISDDDTVTVHIEETAYQVAENQSSVEVCAVIQSPNSTDCPVNFGVSVRFTTTNGDAVAGEDYTRRTTTLSFGSCGRRSCTNVFITNDQTVEPFVEVFTVSLAAVNDDTRIRVRTTNSTVSICDDDDAVVGLDNSMYQGTESVGTIEVCARVESPSVSCPIGMPFSVHISTIDDTAVSSDTQTDFTSLASTTLSFDECERLVCVSITIMNDTMVENTESFNVTLTWTTSLDRRQTEDRRRIKLNPLQVDGVVRITDDDEATVAMEQATVTVMEGDIHPVFVCANVTTPDISCPVDFDFDITFSVNAESTDYDGLPATVKFPACALGTCVNVTIADDAVVENTESFRISLTRTTGLDSRITLTGTTELQISDNDRAVVAMEQSYEYVGESEDNKKRDSDSSIELCAVVENEGSVAFSFNINLLFDSPLDSADINDDFVLPSREYLTFEPMNPESCVTIAIRDSVDLEMPESFFVSLQKPSGLDDRISINTAKDYTEVEIIDDDMATVGFQNTIYTLSSGQSSVRVCVYVHRPRGTDCPIQFPFDMRFQLVDDTNDIFKVDLSSDIVMDDEDSSYLNLLFDSCQRNFCFNIDLKDGVSRPARGKRFPIKLSRTPDHGRSTLLDPVDGEIVIS